MGVDRGSEAHDRIGVIVSSTVHAFQKLSAWAIQGPDQTLMFMLASKAQLRVGDCIFTNACPQSSAAVFKGSLFFTSWFVCCQVFLSYDGLGGRLANL
jgi:hypothetical protein